MNNEFPETNPKEAEIYKFPHKEFKVISLKLKDLQENTDNCGKSGNMHEQNENISKEMETIKKENYTEI